MVLMNKINIEEAIGGLGQSYDELVRLGVIDGQPLKELYPGRDNLHLTPAHGISMSFWADSKRFEALFVTLRKTTPSTIEYEGYLPEPFTSGMAQSDVHETFGEPMEARGPIRMPEPMGQTGGWESYQLDPAFYPGIKVVFQYTAAMEVKTLVFTLIDKGHP
jgi:hypothetical protein